MKLTFSTTFAIACALILSACSPRTERAAPISADTYFEIQIGEATAHLQLALTDPERSKGLMNRTELEQDHGMLFLFPSRAQRSFWMRNTLIPLDIGFFDTDGKLTETRSLYPHDETPVKSYSNEIVIAVEMDRGWFAKNKVRPGMYINLETLREKVKQRGHNIHSFDLNETN
ncbi:MAG TPA: hypothetical protein DCX06_02495 [Opitutae bacterium]|nr:hypothetical protein [Opitutae bacterium]